MNPRTERHVRIIAAVVGTSAGASFGYALVYGDHTPRFFIISMLHGVIISFVLSSLEIFLGTGPAGRWIGDQPFALSLLVRSAVYAAVILAVIIAFIHLGYEDSGVNSSAGFWRAAAFSAAIAVAINFLIEMSNLLGRRTLLNFLSGRYHAPVEENRFVLFVDIVGSTGLAERLGGIGIHRFLDRTFRLLTQSVVDARGEVLDYVGDELIVTWAARDGSVDARPLRCFVAMRVALAQAAPRFEQEFGATPQIRGSLNFGPVIIGEIGDIKRAIVFNGDTMNTASRLEQLSREVDGGFLASAAAIAQCGPASMRGLRNLGRFEIRGRADGIEAFGLARM